MHILTYVNIHIINEETMIELGHHHFVTCKELMDKDNSHQWLKILLNQITRLYERITTTYEVVAF